MLISAKNSSFSLFPVRFSFFLSFFLVAICLIEALARCERRRSAFRSHYFHNCAHCAALWGDLKIIRVHGCVYTDGCRADAVGKEAGADIKRRPLIRKDFNTTQETRRGATDWPSWRLFTLSDPFKSDVFIRRGNSRRTINIKKDAMLARATCGFYAYLLLTVMMIVDLFFFSRGIICSAWRTRLPLVKE